MTSNDGEHQSGQAADSGDEPVKADANGSDNDIGAFIKQQRELAELSLRRLAEMAGVSNPYLSQIERGLRRPSATILSQLARALELSAETMYVQAGILDEDSVPQDASLETAIRRASELTEEQRKALLSVYRSYVAANSAR